MTATPVVRNVHFPLERVPRRWHSAGQSVTTFFDNLSLFFPPGERFFINAVRAHRDVVKDPLLAERVKAFVSQEAFHMREHARVNEFIGSHGYPAAAINEKVEAILRRVTEALTPRQRLAVTCALEHFTALMAHMLLEDPRALEGAHPTMAALWRWHAAEEVEHKAVAYDVYRATGDHYFERVSIMIFTTIIFWQLVVRHQARLMKTDGTERSLKEWTRVLWFAFVRPGPLARVARLYFRYYLPRFHPDDIDCSALVEQWRVEHARSTAYKQVA